MDNGLDESEKQAADIAVNRYRVDPATDEDLLRLEEMIASSGSIGELKKSLSPRDGDGDGLIDDGKPTERPTESSGQVSEDFATHCYLARVVPDGWYVHGRAERQSLREDYSVQLTRRWEIAEQYSGFSNGKENGSMWMIKPRSNAKVVDFSNSDVSNEWAKKAIDAHQNDLLLQYSDFDDVVSDVIRQHGVGDEGVEALAAEMNPIDIVESARLFDVPGFTGWLLHENYVDLCITEDGGVCLNTENCYVRRVDYNEVVKA